MCWNGINTLLNIIFLCIIFFLLYKYDFFNHFKGKSLTIKEISLGIGSGSITLTPNTENMKVAYKLWVEISTRKLALPFNKDSDVIVEVYDSWYEFFKITRELIKDIPIDKVNDEDTKNLINISCKLLNYELRDHLTKWQAKFRKWYDIELSKNENKYLTPQRIQKKYPKYDELIKDIIKINKEIIYYKDILYEIAFDEE